MKQKSSGNQPNRRKRAGGESDAPVAANSVSRQPFRRGRTLTGSSSSKVSSSNEENASLLSPRAHSHHLRRHRRRLLAKLTVVAILCISTYLLLSQFTAGVRVSTTANSSRSLSSSVTDTYEETINRYLNQRPTERYAPLLKNNELLAFLQASHPEILTAELKPTAEYGEVQARIKLRTPVARWLVNGTTQYVDETGVVFRYTDSAPPSVKIVDENEQVLRKNKTVTSQRFLVFVGLAVGAYKERGYTVASVSMPLLTTRQLSVSIKGVGTKIKMTVERGAGEQVEDSVRLMRYLQKRDIEPSYIDVRVPGKAYYK